jgi:hypothetical protein
MRVLDHQGVFTRPAGQNSKYKMANDAPYDGMSVGSFLGDCVQQFDIYFRNNGTESISKYLLISSKSASSPFWTTVAPGDHTVSTMASRLELIKTAQGGLREGPETRVASVSAYVCIKY